MFCPRYFRGWKKSFDLDISSLAIPDIKFQSVHDIVDAFEDGDLAVWSVRAWTRVTNTLGTDCIEN